MKPPLASTASCCFHCRSRLSKTFHWPIAVTQREKEREREGEGEEKERERESGGEREGGRERVGERERD